MSAATAGRRSSTGWGVGTIELAASAGDVTTAAATAFDTTVPTPSHSTSVTAQRTRKRARARTARGSGSGGGGLAASGASVSSPASSSAVAAATRAGALDAWGVPNISRGFSRFIARRAVVSGAPWPGRRSESRMRAASSSCEAPVPLWYRSVNVWSGSSTAPTKRSEQQASSSGCTRRSKAAMPRAAEASRPATAAPTAEESGLLAGLALAATKRPRRLWPARATSPPPPAMLLSSSSLGSTSASASSASSAEPPSSWSSPPAAEVAPCCWLVRRWRDELRRRGPDCESSAPLASMRGREARGRVCARALGCGAAALRTSSK